MDFNALITQIVGPLKEMMVGAIGFIPTLVTLLLALLVLAIGWVIAQMVTKLIVQFLRIIKFDKGADTIGLTKVLKKGGMKQKPSTLFGCITYWVMMVFVLITTVNAFGLAVTGDFISTIMSYIPHVIGGALTLIIGMLVAKVVSTLVYVTAKNTDMPIPETLRNLSQLAIVVYVAILFLQQIGFVSLFEGYYHYLIGGVAFAVAIAFGLAGKDIASQYLHVLDKKEHHA